MKKNLLFATIALFIINACGGGGGSVAEHITKGEMAKITGDNKNDAIATAISSLESGGSVDELGVYGRERSDIENDKINFSKSLKLIKNSRVVSKECESGSVEFDDEKLTITYKSCKFSNITIDGKIKYNSIPEDGHVDAVATNFKITSGSDKAYYEKLSLKINGNNYDLKSTGYIKEGGVENKFLNLHITIKDDKTTIDGSVSSSCIGGKWIDIKTKAPLVDSKNYLDCPDKGDIVIKGKSSEVELIFDADYNEEEYEYNSQEYKIIYNGQESVYNNCDDFEDAIKSDSCAI